MIREVENTRIGHELMVMKANVVTAAAFIVAGKDGIQITLAMSTIGMRIGVFLTRSVTKCALGSAMIKHSGEGSAMVIQVEVHEAIPVLTVVLLKM